MKWINISNCFPNKGEYVLIETNNCKYPCCVGFFNGVKWIDAIDKTEIMNVTWWSLIKKRTK